MKSFISPLIRLAYVPVDPRPLLNHPQDFQLDARIT